MTKKKSKKKSKAVKKTAAVVKKVKPPVLVLPESDNGRCKTAGKGGFVYHLELDRISEVKAVRSAAALLRADLTIEAVGIWEDDSEKKVNLTGRVAAVTQLFTSWVTVVDGKPKSDPTKVRAVVDPTAKKKDLPRFELALTFNS